MKLLAFAASSSTQSINKKLVTHAANVFQSEISTDAEIELLDLNDYEMPIYSSDREDANGIPEKAHVFYNKITACDGLIISFAEHNGLYSAAYKNILDWMSRIHYKVFQGKPIVMLATSPGKGGGRNVLKSATEAAGRFDFDLRGQLSVPSFSDNFDADVGKLKDAELASQLLTELRKLV